MSHRFLVPAAVAAAFLTAAPPGHAAPPSTGQPLDVRVSVALAPNVPLSERQRRAMTQEAEAIWRPYGVALVWLAAGTGEPAPGITLRVEFLHSDRPAYQTATAGGSGLGAIQFLGGGVPDDLILLSTDTIVAMVTPAQWPGDHFGNTPQALADEVAGRAIGRVLAHELGHYLLALRTHTQQGLMRPSFGARELADRSPQRFRLDAAALSRLRARVGQLTATSTDLPAHSGH